MLKNDSVISIEEFVQRVTVGGGMLSSSADCVEYGYHSGWLEAQDVAGRKAVLQRKTAARILHEFLRRECQEVDEIDGSPAYRLQDLFDCRVCAGHIIQVYMKGIMEDKKTADGVLVFGTEDEVSLKEAENVLERVFYPEKRKCKSMPIASFCPKPDKTTVAEAARIYRENRYALLVDVRTLREYEDNHMEGAVNFPLLGIIKNPYAVCENRDKMILLYCEEGYQSEAAARCLLEAGYEKVAYFAWKTTIKPMEEKYLEGSLDLVEAEITFEK